MNCRTKEISQGTLPNNVQQNKINIINTSFFEMNIVNTGALALVPCCDLNIRLPHLIPFIHPPVQELYVVGGLTCPDYH
jgi:hypothetical protein